MSLFPSIPAPLAQFPARVFPRSGNYSPNSGFGNQIGNVIEPQKLALIQLAGFLTLSLTWLIPAPSVGSQGTWSAPVVGSDLINSYKAPATKFGAGHRGVDYEVNLGQGVFAPAPGKVSFVGKVVDRQVLSLSHDQNIVSSYEPVCSSLVVGEAVSAGDLIGEICEPEQSYVPHCADRICLHFSARNNGHYLSPLWFTGELSQSVLLPWVEPS